LLKEDTTPDYQINGKKLFKNIVLSKQFLQTRHQRNAMKDEKGMLWDGSITILQNIFKAVRFDISQPFLYVLALVFQWRI